MKEEIWLNIPGYQSYEVSNTGKVRSLPRKRMGGGVLVGRILKGREKGLGYKQVILYEDGCKKPIDVHVAVAMAFLGERNGRFVDHIDSNPENNHLENLRYCNRAQNRSHAKKQDGTSSVYKGVSWDERAGKWRAYIRVNKVLRSLGFFENEKDAAIEYNKAALVNFGEFSLINVL